MYQEINWLLSIIVGVILVFVPYIVSITYLPRSTRKRSDDKDPDVTLSHLKYLYAESYTMIVGGLLLIAFGFILSTL